ncbi:hypothetical protein F5148DRAFT_1227021 [Russula earlei]|uniref:Uncharacterized protein n=1 Tax=Russula earlei TaxID=71964 RepID=A0ACC0U1G6_9AGAM|nr:hypothetical protein F5148DRAFT_1227021 [Russula earlei]
MRETSDSVLVKILRRACIRTWIFAKLLPFGFLPVGSLRSPLVSPAPRFPGGLPIFGHVITSSSLPHLSARQLIFLHFFPTQPLGTGAFIWPGLAWPTSLSFSPRCPSPSPPQATFRTITHTSRLKGQRPHVQGWRRICLRTLLLSSLMFRTHVFSTFSTSLPSTSSTSFCDFPIHHSLHTTLARKDIQRVGNSPSSPLPRSISLRTHLTTLSFSPQTRGEVK